MFQRKLGGFMAAAALAAVACAPAASSAPTTGPVATTKPAATTAPVATPAPTAAVIGPGEGALNLVIWAGYAERGEVDAGYNWVTPFETKTGCKVTTTNMTDSANGVSLIQTGQYDGGSFSGNATDRLMASGLAAPVDVSLFANYANVFEGLKMKPHNSRDGVAYGVPHGRGPNLLMYNTETVTPAPTTWDPIWEGASGYAGKISIFDSPDFIADAALHLMVKRPDLGIKNPYQLTAAQLAEAVTILKAQRKAGVLYWKGDTYTDQLTAFGSGESTIGTSWQFQVNLLQADGKPIQGVFPTEGSTGWSDTWMMYSLAKNPNCMLMWMDHMMSAEANGQATVWFGEAPTSQAACDYAETLSAGHCALTHATDEAYYDQVWYWSTARQDCADTDPATTCADQDAWIAAWADVRGS